MTSKIACQLDVGQCGKSDQNIKDEIVIIRRILEKEVGNKIEIIGKDGRKGEDFTDLKIKCTS